MSRSRPRPEPEPRSALPAYAGSVPLILFSRQVAIAGGALHNEVVAADPASGDGVVLGAPRTIAPPAFARPGAGLLVAWPASTGGVAVTLHP